MAAGPFTLYVANLNFLNPAALLAGTIKCALVSSSYTPNYTAGGDTIWGNVSSYEIANGYGYTTGGATVGNGAVVAITGGYKLTSDSIIWTAAGGNIPAWRRAVFYYSGTLGGLTNPLIGSLLGDSTPADIPATVGGVTLILSGASGIWFTVTS